VNFLTKLSSICSNNTDHVLIGGDFNIIRFSYERNRKCGVQRFSDLFNTLINFHELREIEMSGETYTWSNNQEDPILEKLDRILMSKDWEDLFPKCGLGNFLGVRSKWLEGGVKSLFKNLQASLNNHVSIKDG
jgi:hypothetical protein